MGEVGPGSFGELRCHAEADVVFVEIEIDSKSESKVSLIGVVLQIVPDGIGAGDRRPDEIGGEVDRSALVANDPLWKGRRPAVVRLVEPLVPSRC